MIELTPRAQEVLRRAAHAASRFNADARVRLDRGPGGLVTSLADAPEDGDALHEEDGLVLFVAGGLAGTVDVEDPHDRLVLRP